MLKDFFGDRVYLKTGYKDFYSLAEEMRQDVTLCRPGTEEPQNHETVSVQDFGRLAEM